MIPEKMKKRYHKVLTIAGSDSSGGAGIQADLKTFAALGCYGLSVITALTAQNTKGVSSIHSLPSVFVQAQMEAVLSDIGADAVKIGMLCSGEVIKTVSIQLERYRMNNIVLDPILSAHTGERLLEDSAVEALKENLMPLATVLTPNIPEASVLLNRKIHSLEDLREAARTLASYGSESILIKGGHLDRGDCNDSLFIGSEDRLIVFKEERIRTRNDHGTGCTLSSAIASFLAKGLSIEEAVKTAKEYLTGAIKGGAEYEIGHGHGPLHHFFRFW